MRFRGGKIEKRKDKVVEKTRKGGLPPCKVDLKVLGQSRQVVFDRQVQELTLLIHTLR